MEGLSQTLWPLHGVCHLHALLCPASVPAQGSYQLILSVTGSRVGPGQLGALSCLWELTQSHRGIPFVCSLLLLVLPVMAAKPCGLSCLCAVRLSIVPAPVCEDFILGF